MDPSRYIIGGKWEKVMSKAISFISFAIFLTIIFCYMDCTKDKSSRAQEFSVQGEEAEKDESKPEEEKNAVEKSAKQGEERRTPVVSDGKIEFDPENPGESLILAIRDGDIESVVDHLKAGVDPNVRLQFTGETLLTYAMLRNHGNEFDIVKVLIDYGAEVNATDGKGFTALSVASQYGKYDIAKLLFDRGADPNISAAYGETPLMMASFWVHMNIVELLLDHGAKIEAIDRYFFTALDWALAGGNKEIYTLLKERIDRSVLEQQIAEILSKKDEKERLVFEIRIAIWEGKAAKVEELLKEVDPNVHEIKYLPVLCDAVRRGEIEIVQSLLDFGVGVKSGAGAPFYQKPLFAACIYGEDEIVKLLLEHGANINEFPTPLTAAARGGHLSTVVLLLENGADVSEADGFRKTALDYAIENDYDEIAELLRSHK
jgi:ankyrin repeat protein